jgi:hypothetical protein
VQAPQSKARVTISRPNPDDRTFTAFGQSVGPDRSIVVNGHAWTVREAVDPVTLKRTLVFFGTGTARRVRTYPANWRDLSDEQLYALSWSF